MSMRLNAVVAVVVAVWFSLAIQSADAADKAPIKLVGLRRAALAGDPTCCYNPCISYRHRGCQRCCDSCETIQTVLHVKDPCTCCIVEIPVCLPGCCTDCPDVCSKCGLLGRGIVRYDYGCGTSLIVTFKRRGDIVVTYVNGVT